MPRANRLATRPKRKAEFIEPMECAPVPKLLDGPGWVYEIKLDGYRAVAVKSNRVDLFSRRHRTCNSQYPYLVIAVEKLKQWVKSHGRHPREQAKKEELTKLLLGPDRLE